jgi:predicted NACHT family NTPase
MIQRQHLAPTPLSDLQSHPWYDFLSANPTGHAIPTGTLLRAVQSRKQQETYLAEISSHTRPSHSSLEKIQSALKTHYSPNLKILRISGDELDIDTCFVNLAIVEAPAQREREKEELKKLAAVFHRIPSSESVRGSNIESSIRLEQVFDKRMLRDGKEGIPQRILVQGRAGIGKTTLCKKIVHLHQSGLWADRFEAVLWLPLRRLRGSTCRTLESLLREKVYTAQLDREQEELARTLAIRADEGKVLFILDGLDEIVTDVQSEDSPTKALLKSLLGQKHVVITSRPSGLDVSLLQSIELELETIGFSQQDVKEFIDRVLTPGPARTVQDFIQQTPLIQGLVNIPVQLDVICFCWESLPQDGSQITITKLYQLMSRKLWCKDALRLKKGRRGKILTENQIKNLSPKEIDRLMSIELRHLGHLAFKGLENNHQIEFNEAALLDVFEDLVDTDSTDDDSPYSSEVLDMVKETSFLHSADADLDTSKKSSQRSWSFLHLTFQEYFAATWIALKLTSPGRDGK